MFLAVNQPLLEKTNEESAGGEEGLIIEDEEEEIVERYNKEEYDVPSPIKKIAQELQSIIPGVIRSGRVSRLSPSSIAYQLYLFFDEQIKNRKLNK